MISEAVILALIFSGVLAAIGAYRRSSGVILVSTFGEWIAAIRLFDDLNGDALPSILLIAIGLIQFFVLARW